MFFAFCCTAVPLGASCVNTRILASLSAQIGEVASMAAIEGMIPGAEQLPSALPGDAELLETAVQFREAINEDRFVDMLGNQKFDDNIPIEPNLLLNQFENESSSDACDPS
ncbi:MAG: hypothetical protein RLZZ519_2540 [Bacteroidota bacterium]